MTTDRLEKRRTPRCAIDFFVQEVCEDRTFLHPTIDLSPDGLYILAWDDRKALDGDRELTVEFELPTGRVIRARTRVVHVDLHHGRRGLRLAFRELSADDREAIAAFVDGVIAEERRAD